jgi:hypothetical protein
MVIIGVDYHPSIQQIAFVDTETGERGERRLNHKVLVGLLGRQAPAGCIGAAGPVESHDCEVNRSRRAGSQKTPRSAAINDPPGRGPTDSTGLRANHRDSGAVSLWQADRQLCRTHPLRGLQCGPATVGTHQQARERAAAQSAVLNSTSMPLWKRQM